MNVLVIPSWYPSRRNPLSGIFCKEQAEALAEFTDCNIIVCDWGQGDGAVSGAHPLESLSALWWRLQARRELRKGGFRFTEFFEPTLLWSPKMPGGGDEQIAKAIRRVYADAVKVFGKIDLLHAHVCYPGGYLASELSAETGVPLIITEHWGSFPGKLINGRPRPEIESAMNRAAAVISVSRAAATKMEAFGYQHIQVIPNLVDESRFTVKPVPSGPFRFFSMGGITRGKGFDVLLKAIARWAPPSGEVEFIIAGEGALKRELQSLAKSLGIDEVVQWIGTVSRNEAPACYQECNAFVLPSRKESFGVVYAEAIASGRPVIATFCGGPEDIVNDGNGFLVPTEDVEQLAVALERMKAEYCRFNPAAIREDFMRRFSRPAVTGKIRQLYADILGGNRTA